MRTDDFERAASQLVKWLLPRFDSTKALCFVVRGVSDPKITFLVHRSSNYTQVYCDSPDCFFDWPKHRAESQFVRPEAGYLKRDGDKVIWPSYYYQNQFLTADRTWWVIRDHDSCWNDGWCEAARKGLLDVQLLEVTLLDEDSGFQVRFADLTDGNACFARMAQFFIETQIAQGRYPGLVTMSFRAHHRTPQGKTTQKNVKFELPSRQIEFLPALVTKKFKSPADDIWHVDLECEHAPATWPHY